MISFYGKELLSLKANLHTHTTCSDGKFSPEEVIRLYSDAGYDVLSLTDHRTTQDISRYNPENLLLIPGIEIHPHDEHSTHHWHLVGLNVPLDFRHPTPEKEGLNVQQSIDLLREAGALPFIAHPYWCGFTSADLRPLTGYYGMEVYNTECRNIGRAYSIQTWDELLEAGRDIPVTAVDDMHSAASLFQGWTVICAEKRTLESVLDALRNGNFYASQGPEFRKLSFENGVFSAEFSPVVSAHLVMQASRGRIGLQPNQDGPGTPFREIERMEFDLNDLPPGSYFRCQIIDRNGRFAWSNSIRIQ